jgi:hypothetical protein
VEESQDIASYLITLKRPDVTYSEASYLDDPLLKEKGIKLVRHYGCAGCHEISGLEDEGRIGTELTKEGSACAREARRAPDRVRPGPAPATPRRAAPRKEVPAGSVAIGGAQTGIYPRNSPGGWNVIGRTPLRLFDVRREPPTILQAGDHVRFRKISREEFDAFSQ